MPGSDTTIDVRVNGTALEATVQPGELLLGLLRDRLGLRGTKLSCGAQVCGACTVLVEGRPVSSCCYLAVDAEGRDVLTIEGAQEDPVFARIEEALLAHQAVQCGFCTPGFVMTLLYLARRPDASTEDLPAMLSGNLCRCTGYKSLLAAAADVLRAEAAR